MQALSHLAPAQSRPRMDRSVRRASVPTCCRCRTGILTACYYLTDYYVSPSESGSELIPLALAMLRDMGIYCSTSPCCISLFKYLWRYNKLLVPFIYQRRSWLFSKGLPAIALAQARRAGDILKRIPPQLAVAPEVGFTPWKPGSLHLAHLNPTSVTTSREANRYRLEKMGMTG